MLAATLAAHTTVALQNGRRLAHEHRVAEYLQQSMLPAIPRIPGVEIDVAYESATDATLVGGDFFDVIPLKRKRTAVVVGDVCGKGLRAATRMAAVRHTLRAYAVLDPDPGRVAHAGQREPGRPRATPLEFVTVALVVVDQHRRGAWSTCSRVTRARLWPPRGRCIELVGAHDLPLGVGNGQRYRTQLTQVPEDSTLVLFTDGLYEARSGHRHVRHLSASRPRLVALAVDTSAGIGRPPGGRSRAFSGGRLADDVVVMLVRLTGR